MELNAEDAGVLSLRAYDTSHGSHDHDHVQVLLGWQGTLELEVEGRGRRVERGDVALIPPKVRHDFQAADGRSARCFVLDSRHPCLSALDGQGRRWPPEADGLLRFLSTAPGRPQALAASVPLLLHTLAHTHAAPLPSGGRRIDWDRLSDWVDRHLHEPVDVARLALQVHLSPSQFAQRCVERWGLPPAAWVRRRRLDAARRWRQEGMAVQQVAQRCGYRSPSALTAALRRDG